MAYKILHILSQRPSLTGSGVTLEAMVHYAAQTGWEQCVVVGAPQHDSSPTVADLAPERIRPLLFGGDDLPFAVPGMSDVMPYSSTRFSAMGDDQIAIYLQAWKKHLAQVVGEFQPQVIHAHHVWLVSSLLKDIAPHIPVLNQCHATGLRQMELCPHLADRVKKGCARNERFQVLYQEHAAKLTAMLGVSSDRIFMIPSGYREDLFNVSSSVERNRNAILYTGKYSAAKGLPWLLDAFERLSARNPALELHVAGSGAGPEAELLKQRMLAMSPRVIHHDQLQQSELADLMRKCAVFVLPSFYEGIPLVLVEALACGCRLVSTRLSGVEDKLFPDFKVAMDLVPLPRLLEVDRPMAEDIPAFVENLTQVIEISLKKKLPDPKKHSIVRALIPFTWKAIFKKVEKIWLGLINE